MAATVQVADLRAVGGDVAATSAVQVFDLRAAGGLAPSSIFVRVTDLRAVGGVAPSGGTVRLVELVAVGGPQAAVLAANAGADQGPLEPGITVTLDGSRSTGSFTSASWSQLGGFTVGLSLAGVVQTFRAPPVMDGTTLTFRLTITDGVTTATDDVVVTVLEATTFQRVGGAWVPRIISRRASGQWS